MTGGWTRPDVDKSHGCRTPDCALGCQDIPSPAVYARAAVLAAGYAADYRRRVGQEVNAARAERAAQWLRGVTAGETLAPPPAAPPRVQGGLTWAQARAIRARYTGAPGAQAALARAYGVSPTTVCRLLKGQLWAEEEAGYRIEIGEELPPGLEAVEHCSVVLSEE